MGCGCLKSQVVVKSKIKPDDDINLDNIIIQNANSRANHNSTSVQAHQGSIMNIEIASNIPINLNRNNQNLSSHNNMGRANNHNRQRHIANLNSENPEFASNLGSVLNNNLGNINLQNNINNSNNDNINSFYQDFIGNFLNINPNYEPYLESRHDENFNFPEIDNEYSGTGIKRMKAYKSPISKEDLEKKRVIFWETKIDNNKQIWEVLRLLCTDKTLCDKDIETIMKEEGIVTYKGCINVTYDSKGALYEIPNYCINEPKFYIIENDAKEKPEKINLEIKIKSYNNKIKIKTTNYIFVRDLKDMISKYDAYKNMLKENIRLFFYGKEMKDEKELWFYNICNKAVVQMLIKHNSITKIEEKINEKDAENNEANTNKIIVKGDDDTILS